MDDHGSRKSLGNASGISRITKVDNDTKNGPVSKAARHTSPKRLLLDAIASRKNSNVEPRLRTLKTSRSKTFHQFGESLRPGSIFGFWKPVDEVNTQLRFVAKDFR